MTAHMKEILLNIENLTIGHKDKVLYEGVCLDIREGDCIMLCGANGSGKTTLLKTIAGMRGDISMIPSRIPKVPGFTLKEFIGLALNNNRSTQLKEESISAAMAKMNITSLTDRDIATLSDGEFQKGCIAIALAKKSAIILLDEPTVFLDAENRIKVLQNLREICDRGSDRLPAVIFSTHDLYEGTSVCNKVIALGADGIFRCATENISETVATIFG